MLGKPIRYSCIYEARMSPALNGSSAVRCLKCGNTIKIHDEIIFDLWPHIMHLTTPGRGNILCT